MHSIIVGSIGILGVLVGSFLSVIIFRMNTGKGVGGRSQCLSCNKTLSWYELIPLISFVAQQGKCQSCKSIISRQDPLVELITGLLFAGAAYRIDIITQPITLVLWLVLISLGMIIAVYDINHHVIAVKPFIGFFLICVILGMDGLGLVLVPLPFLMLWLVSQGKWIGFGDIELMACMGLLLGVISGYSALMLSFWIACAVILPWYGIQKLRKKNPSRRIPFGPFLLMGMYVVAIGGFDVLKLILGVIQ